MKILFFGDSITDVRRNRERDFAWDSYGAGYVKFVADELLRKDSTKYEIYNRGISGNRVVDLYARIKSDCWNIEPDVLSILIGINDVWHEITKKNGVDIERFEKVYRMIIEDTVRRFQKLKIVLCEPFVLRGSATEERFENFLEVYNYAKVVEKLATEYGLLFLPLQKKLSESAKIDGTEKYLADGVHPTEVGAKLIADEWVRLFREKIER